MANDKSNHVAQKRHEFEDKKKSMFGRIQIILLVIYDLLPNELSNICHHGHHFWGFCKKICVSFTLIRNLTQISQPQLT
jgi:hypothetical protein